MFVLWHFTKDKPVAQLQGVFDTEELVQNACEVGDCYIELELNMIYNDDIDTETVALYKCPSGLFKSIDGYRMELNEEE